MSDSPVCRAQYQLILDRRQTNFSMHFETSTLSSKHQDAHQRLLDIETVYKSAGGRREAKIFNLALQLLGDGLSQVACGNYRLAFFCLRSFLELSVAAIRFSAFEFELREWEASRRDVSWSVLSSDEIGCFSLSFVGAFFPELRNEARHYLSLAKRAYRESSEYVHGNPKSHGISHGIDEDRANHWFELLDGASTAVLFCYFARYLGDLPRGQFHGDLLDILKVEVGHFSGVKEFLLELEQNG